jgi:hypothetical protein
MNDDDKFKQAYSDLERLYDLTNDRRKTLNDQASTLVTYAGIIETILVGVMITLATNANAKSLITGSYLSSLLVLGVVGFVSYMVSVIVSLLAFHELKWIPAPEPLGSDTYRGSHLGKDDWREQNNLAKETILQKLVNSPDLVNLNMFGKQLINAIGYMNDINEAKYDKLRIAFIFLVVGLMATGVFGVILILSIF